MVANSDPVLPPWPLMFTRWPRSGGEPERVRVLKSVLLSNVMSGLVVVLVKVAPPKTPMPWFVVMLEPDAWRKGPASEMLAGDAAVENGLGDEMTRRSRLIGVVPSISVPPVTTVLPVRLMSALALLLVNDER